MKGKTMLKNKKSILTLIALSTMLSAAAAMAGDAHDFAAQYKACEQLQGVGVAVDYQMLCLNAHQENKLVRSILFGDRHNGAKVWDLRLKQWVYSSNVLKVGREAMVVNFSNTTVCADVTAADAMKLPLSSISQCLVPGKITIFTAKANELPIAYIAGGKVLEDQINALKDEREEFRAYMDQR